MTRPIITACGRDSYLIREGGSLDTIGVVSEQRGQFTASRFGTRLGEFPSLEEAASHIAQIDEQSLGARP